jgi:hypothetical protein
MRCRGAYAEQTTVDLVANTVTVRNAAAWWASTSKPQELSVAHKPGRRGTWCAEMPSFVYEQCAILRAMTTFAKTAAHARHMRGVRENNRTGSPVSPHRTSILPLCHPPYF